MLERQAPQVQLSALGAQKVQFCYLFKDMLAQLHLQVCDDSLPVCYSYLISPQTPCCLTQLSEMFKHEFDDTAALDDPASAGHVGLFMLNKIH